MFKLTKEINQTKDSLSFADDDDGIQHIKEISETAETIKELNDDSVTKDGFTNIDMKTRLHPIEISSIIALDSLLTLKFLPRSVGFITRSKKRLAVSQLGLGRSEVVQISQGLQQQKQGTSFLDRVGNFFGGNKQ